jgi:hypothetical protein
VVDAEGEGEVPVGLRPADVQAVRIGEGGGVPVRPPDGHEDLLPLRDGRPVELDVLGGHPAGRLDGAVEAQELLHRPGSQLRLVAEALPLPRRVDERPGAVADEVDGGLEPRHEQQHAGADQFVEAQPVPFLFGGDQRREEGVVGPVPPVADQRIEVGTQLDLGPHALLVGAVDLGLQGGGDHLAPGPEAVPVGVRDPEELDDDPDRQRVGQRLDEIEAGRGVDVVEEVPGARPDPGFELGQPARAEGRGDQAANPGVVGRVHLQE